MYQYQVFYDKEGITSRPTDGMTFAFLIMSSGTWDRKETITNVYINAPKDNRITPEKISDKTMQFKTLFDMSSQITYNNTS